MSDYDSNLYCPKCKCLQPFILSGSGRKGACLECSYQYDGPEEYEQDCDQANYLIARLDLAIDDAANAAGREAVIKCFKEWLGNNNLSI